MKNVKPILTIFLVAATLAACNRIENTKTAGKGGNAVLNCVPAHHEVYKNIINAKVYLKYNAQNAPITYDDSVSCTMVDGKPTATFSGLKTGDYYIFASGFDTSVSQISKGGMPYTIASEKKYDLLVPITEGD